MILFNNIKHILKDKLRYFIKPVRLNSTSTLDVNTNVIKDVILYKYENPRFFVYLNVFAITQFGFWGYLSHFAYTTLRDAPVEVTQETSWWRKINLGENKYRNSLAVLSFIIGYGILTVSWMFTLRSVRYLVLRKGGGECTFVTYTPFGKNRMVTVPLSDMSSVQTRSTATTQLPIKVKNHNFYYILDMKGEFKNPTLFDYTAGLKRTLKYK
ncbi:transmembrane protein 223 [Onthophagus taurus]|uniref:transmembrane protein 223 n=1 Tax=Onthophagus taurus TaxID=166361 RepID=UPI000C1FE1A8|nr:transmembrane protein 223 [Onthophagus taurus]